MAPTDTALKAPKDRTYTLADVLLVEGDDDLRLGADGGGQHMAVIGVGQRQRRDQPLIAGYAGVGQRVVHRGASPFQHRRCDIGPCGLHRTQPFGMDIGAPGRAEQARLGQLDLSNSRGRVRSYDDIAPRKSTPGQKFFG